MKANRLTRSSLKMCGALIATATVLAVRIDAQESWSKKAFTHWSKSEAEAVLNDSPWAKKQELRIKFDRETQKAAGSYSGISSSAAAQSQTEVTSQMPVDFIFTLRLRSALPMRQALVRLKALETNVDKMTEQQAVAFDTQMKGLLECPACAANYVVTLSSKSNNSPGADAVYATFKGARLADLQRYVYLANERGERRPLVHFAPPKVPGDEAVFFFPRADEKGAPLLTVDNKELLINLTDNQANSITNFRIDVTKLVLAGKIEF
jgi:hypothetical protein